MDAAVFTPASVCTVMLINKLNKMAPMMGILRWLQNTLHWFVLAGIGFLLTMPFWRRKSKKLDKKRDEESDLVFDSDSADDLETNPPVRPLHPKREAAADILPGESPKRAKTEKMHLINDELYCEYDSTWEDSDSPTPVLKVSVKAKRFGRPMYNPMFARFENAARDMQNYRHNYPGNVAIEQWKREPMPNLMFYIGKIPSIPDGIFISEFHRAWRGDYDKLERVHTFIQWLFPLQEPGLNYQAWELTKEEVEHFIRNDVAKDNLLKSYKLMLDFYGIKLTNEKTGEVARASNWQERFYNLNRYTHNNLRITRILKCLGNLGYRHYQAPLVCFFLEETLIHGNLPRVKESVLSYFMFAVLKKTERRELIKFAYQHYDPQEEFIWCPKIIQMRWSPQVKRTYSNQQMEMNTRDDKPSRGNAQVWKPHASTLSIKARSQFEDEIGDEASEHFNSSSSVFGNAGGLTWANIWAEGTMHHRADDKGEHLRNLHLEGAIATALSDSTTQENMEDQLNVVSTRNISPSDAAIGLNEQSLHVPSPSEGTVKKQGFLPSGEDKANLPIQGEKPRKISGKFGDEVGQDMEISHSLLNSAASGQSTDPEHPQNDNTRLNAFMEMNLPLPSPVGGDNHTQEKMSGRGEKPTAVSQTCVYPNEGSSTNKNAEEDQSEDEDL